VLSSAAIKADLMRQRLAATGSAMNQASVAILFALSASLAAPTAAAETPTVSTTSAPQDERQLTEEKAVQAYGSDNETCREWTDGCIICLRGPDRIASCSLPGIACQPHGTACTGPIESPAPLK
jgi:hypothetical protein